MIKVVVTGVTGMVGEGVMLECLANPEVQEVLATVSKPADAVCEHCDKDAAAAVVANKDAAKGAQPQAAAK